MKHLQLKSPLSENQVSQVQTALPKVLRHPRRKTRRNNARHPAKVTYQHPTPHTLSQNPDPPHHLLLHLYLDHRRDSDKRDSLEENSTTMNLDMRMKFKSASRNVLRSDTRNLLHTTVMKSVTKRNRDDLSQRTSA
jgi:hypothetical protein